MRPHFEAPGVALYLGDCRRVMAGFEAESFEAVITDPPYSLGFMGRAWDKHGGPLAFERWCRLWGREALRVLKPGAHLLAFGSPRTYHRLAAGLEDAGFEIRDTIAWLYGSGFPKSLDLGRGLGTALKPANEPIVVARRPPRGSIAANVEAYGTGGLNIDAARIPFTSEAGRWPANVILGCACEGDHAATCASRAPVEAGRPIQRNGTRPLGDGWRFEAESEAERPGDPEPCDCGWRHLEGCAVAALDAQAPAAGGGFGVRGASTAIYGNGNGFTAATGETVGYGDTGGASRFFYVAKASAEERNFGLEHLPKRTPAEITGRLDGSAGLDNPRAGTRSGARANHHPTVKPVDLMRYLIRLAAPPGGRVLDPFLGSGTTKVAAIMEGRPVVGIEIDPESMAIAEARAAQATLFA